MENGSLQYENQILKSELEAEHFILTQMAELGKVRNVRECQVAINNLLEKIGHFTKADRAYIVDEKDGCYYNTYEWCNEGIEPQINQLQNLRAEDMPYWIPKLSSGESIFIEDLENVKETMPVEYEILKPQNIHTLIVFPIILSNTLKGFIGVDNPNIKDAKDVIRLLAALGSYLGTTRENAAVYAKLEYRLNYDSLTKAYNRYGFYKNAQKLIKEHTDTEYCLILSDIKSFKLINEIYGENIADKILIDEVNIIRQKMKGNSVLGRLNGDIIAMVIPKEYLSEKEFSDMIKLLSDRYSNKNFRLHIYLGVYYIKDVNETIRQMVDKVSLVIMKSKGNMSNYILYYDENSYRNDIFKQQLIGEFETALNENQFCMYLQPQTDKDGNMLGAEALIRWNHPNMGLIMPGAFIECFEDAGLIYRLDNYIWEEAAKQLKIWKDSGYNYYISVNISAKDFYHIDVYQTFKNLVSKYGIDTDKLHIEITETALSEDKQAAHKTIERLHDEGFIIEIDDFGSGYSSFNFLKDVCADVIKIDRVFLKKSSHEERGEQILRSIISLSHDIGMDVITEGVENVDQLSMLAKMNCDWFQGYYFSKPIAVGDFEEKYGIKYKINNNA
ncbi:MAG: EAL domain-containing protein [Lachnospira pectinoschiza]|jgi:diguanylate cyclase (GGDEF)-like protein|uniref:GGDEF domain-containing phosphodiesterase n=1 Tax=[Lactobacillus] rogosae TaxID=706562 RepID=A0ABV1BUA4_9FIRM|nr:sensor domain-containing phosphodiesterase [Eubacterium sp.]MEE0564659.1 GGDEF domain-containing phosphodiesterase [Lactobacillus rogosae]